MSWTTNDGSHLSFTMNSITGVAGIIQLMFANWLPWTVIIQASVSEALDFCSCWNNERQSVVWAWCWWVPPHLAMWMLWKYTVTSLNLSGNMSACSRNIHNNHIYSSSLPASCGSRCWIWSFNYIQTASLWSVLISALKWLKLRTAAVWKYWMLSKWLVSPCTVAYNSFCKYKNSLKASVES